MQGPLAKYYDANYDNLYCEKQNWEQAENAAVFRRLGYSL